MLPAQAQTLVFDGTTGPAQTLTGPVYEIEQALGTIAGTNLFHSFEQFDLGRGDRANFRAAPEVRNILTRVTGGAASTIDGVLATPGSTADFYLINPAGVVFGPGGKLELGGSFIGTTASAVLFGEVGEFSAVQPQTAGLLTIAPSALVFSDNVGRIVSQSVAEARTSAWGRERFGLQVPDGESLLLVGGDILIDGGGVSSGGLQAVGGRLELGGLAEAGEVQLTQIEPLGLQYPQGAALANVQLANNALVTVAGTGGGDLVVNASQLEGLSGGRLLAGTSGADNAGNLVINAQDIEFRGGFSGGVLANARSGAVNDVIQGGTGNGGELVIRGDRLFLYQGAQVGNSIFGTGSTGDVVLAIRDAIELDATTDIATNSVTGIFNDLQNGSSRSKGGRLIIQTQRLEVKGGAQISTSLIQGQGESGDIQIEAKDVQLEGLTASTKPGGIFASGITSGVRQDTEGKGGNITIKAERLVITNGARISTLLRGSGAGGSISIEATESVELSGEEQLDQTNSSSAILAGSLPGSAGKAGQITIVSPLLSLSSGSFIDSDTANADNSGDIQLRVDKLQMFQRGSDKSFSGRISSATTGSGSAGKILIEAKEISIFDNGNIDSSVFPMSEPASDTERAGGAIEIQTGLLEMQEASIFSDLLGDGSQAGDISIQVEESAVLRSTTIVATSINNAVQGTGGDIALRAGSLRLIDSNLLSGTLGSGNAGSIQIQSKSDIALEGETSISALSIGENSGSASDIYIQADTFSAIGEIDIASLTSSNRDAGSIEIEASRIIFEDGVELEASTAGAGQGGGITLNAQSVELFDALIQAGSISSGDAGTIRVRASDNLRLGQSLISGATAGTGAGGDVALVSPEIEIVNSSITAQSRSEGSVGSISIEADKLAIQNDSGIFFSALSPEASIDGGSIDIGLSSALLLAGDSGIFATATDQAPQGGSGGTVNIVAPFVIGLPGQNGDISTSGIGGDGGRINIDAKGVFNFKIAPQNGPTAAELRRNTDNDISSTSQVTQGGTVLVSGLNVDPAQGAAEQPINFTDPSQQIAQRCASTAASSSFVSTGRNGIPLNPTDAQTLSNTEADWAALPPSTATAPVEVSAAEPTTTLTEVTHWQRNTKGVVTLLAAQPQRLAFDAAHCAKK